MSWRPGSWALPWALLPLLFGFCLLETYSVITEEQNDLADRKVMNSYLPATVEFALYTFNQQSKDEQAYRLERILASWRDKVRGLGSRRAKRLSQSATAATVPGAPGICRQKSQPHPARPVLSSAPAVILATMDGHDVICSSRVRIFLSAALPSSSLDVPTAHGEPELQGRLSSSCPEEVNSAGMCMPE